MIYCIYISAKLSMLHGKVSNYRKVLGYPEKKKKKISDFAGGDYMREGDLGKETWGPTSTSRSEYPLPIKHGNRNSCVLDDVPSFIHLHLQWISHSCAIIFS